MLESGRAVQDCGSAARVALEALGEVDGGDEAMFSPRVIRLLTDPLEQGMTLLMEAVMKQVL